MLIGHMIKKLEFLINRINYQAELIITILLNMVTELCLYPYLYNYSLDNYVIMGVHRLYHENGILILKKLLLQLPTLKPIYKLPDNLVELVQTTSINVEHGITMTEGPGASDSTVSVDKTNGVNIQNTDLAITGGNIIVTNGTDTKVGIENN